jgi:hypothetical protein
MSENFEDLLSKNAEEIEAPKPLPAGTYRALILDHSFDKTQRKGTDFVQWTIRPTDAGDDVDADELAEMPEWNQKNLRYRLYITPNSLFMVERFLEETLQIDPSNKTLREMIEESDEQELTIEVAHEPITDSNGNPTDDVRAVISDVAPAE